MINISQALHRTRPNMPNQQAQSSASRVVSAATSPTGTPVGLSFNPQIVRQVTLPQWQGLKPGLNREYTGAVYDKSLVKRVYANEVYGWEHTKTTPALIEIANRDAWEELAVPPISLSYSEKGITINGNTYHYAVQDGHHRLNAVSVNTAGVPAMVTSRWIEDAQGQSLGYQNRPVSTRGTEFSTDWNPGKVPQKIYVEEKINLETVWGNLQLGIMLPADKKDLSLTDIAAKLNIHTTPDRYFEANRGNDLRIRITFQDVYGKSGGKLSDMHHDIVLKDVDLNAKDWRTVFTDNAPIRSFFENSPWMRSSLDKYPIMLVQLQQDRYVFKTPGW